MRLGESVNSSNASHQGLGKTSFPSKFFRKVLPFFNNVDLTQQGALFTQVCLVCIRFLHLVRFEVADLKTGSIVTL